jgi:hypothetical protein
MPTELHKAYLLDVTVPLLLTDWPVYLKVNLDHFHYIA